MSEYHGLEVVEGDDGWDIPECDCGWVGPPCPDRDTAAEFWGAHLLQEQGDPS